MGQVADETQKWTRIYGDQTNNLIVVVVFFKESKLPTLLEQYYHHNEIVGLIPIDSSPFLSFVCDLPYKFYKGYGKTCFQVFKSGIQNYLIRCLTKYQYTQKNLSYEVRASRRLNSKMDSNLWGSNQQSHRGGFIVQGE